ncbi:hypothetical protein MKW94_007258 [Papaver nudicaule]|uniref:Leucine-rich repeat-containing N-terminal plant-type domain-containing protein n=1 Tax=Papaver nudicaule TaxID=74823 RepID=A0AA41SFA2_PAPNU|nr:hypothetical protein [Papaver nudicaule]
MKIQYPSSLYYSLSLLLLSATILISPSLGALGKCNPSDYKALMSIKNSLNNTSILDSWAHNTDSCNNWIGVRCDDKTNRVNDLFLFIGELSGQIPSSVGDLPYLISLAFRHYKNITGPIPQSITKLKHLVMLDLSDMSLSGPIPHFLDQLTTLNSLDLSDNQFSGSIPPNLSTLKNIGILHLSGNKLTGSIPESFGKFTGTIRDLTLSRNKLTGSIPKSLGAMDFGEIDLSRNKLVGDASMLFHPNSSTWHIDLSRNQFEFDLTKVKFPKDLNWLDISRNKIFGGIPEEIIGLEQLYKLKLGYNRLCGKIPTGGIMQRFKSTSFYHNKCLE